MLPLFCLLFFASCQNTELSVVLADHENGSFEAERLWLEEVLSQAQELALRIGPPENAEGDIFIDFFSAWEYEDEHDGITLSRTWFVPSENALAGRRNVSLQSCLDGEERLVPLDELKPPFVALRVDGYTVGDEGYPLVRRSGIRLRVGKETKGRAKRVAALEEWLLGLPKPLAERPVLTWVSAGGDVLLGRTAEDVLLDEGPRALLGGALDVFMEADLAMVNLEGSLSSRGEPAAKTYTFRFEPPLELAAALKNIGITAVLLANNHTFDYGEEAFLDTLDFLEQAGVGAIGAGRNEEAVLNPWNFEKDRFAARLWGLASFPREWTGWDGLQFVAGTDKAGYLHARAGGGDALMAQLQQQSGDGTLNIVLFHGGEEFSPQPSRATRELYTSLAREGADLLIGTHPHVVHGFEWAGESLIFWSLGDLIFADMEDTPRGDDSLLIRLGYRGRQPIYIEPVAIVLSGPRVELAPEEKLEDFYQKSRQLAESLP